METYSNNEEKKNILEKREDLESSRLLERRRNRTSEMIESFNINDDGLAIHGIKKGMINDGTLEKILKNGLGYHSGKNICSEVWFNVVGTSAISYGENGEEIPGAKIGFGEGRVKFGSEAVLVNDVFREVWPNMMNGIAKLGDAHNGVGGEIWIEADYFAGDVDMKFTGNDFGKQIDWNNTPELPEPDELLIPEFKKEETWIKDRDGKKHLEAGCVETVLYENTAIVNNEESAKKELRAWRHLLGCAAISGIVISDNEYFRTMSDEDTIKEIIAIQYRLGIPREEQIPVYNESGKCLYNPMEH